MGTKCIAWRQTGGCDPNGPREPHFDKPCDADIPSDASGYCQCFGGIKKMMKGCAKGGFGNCDVACRSNYEIGEENTLCENARIENLEECKDAANQLNIDFGDEEEVSDYPGGCYVLNTVNTMYFNKNFPGAKEEKSQPICGQELSGKGMPCTSPSGCKHFTEVINQG